MRLQKIVEIKRVTNVYEIELQTAGDGLNHEKVRGRKFALEDAHI